MLPDLEDAIRQFDIELLQFGPNLQEVSCIDACRKQWLTVATQPCLSITRLPGCQSLRKHLWIKPAHVCITSKSSDTPTVAVSACCSSSTRRAR
jgi:hypothetical protein